jgi:hypothetical protein
MKTCILSYLQFTTGLKCDDDDDKDDDDEDAVLLCGGEREHVSIKFVQSEISNDH